MNTYLRSNLIFFHSIIAALMSACISMDAADTIKDDIKLTVSSTKDENGDTKINCVLTNDSSSVLAYFIWAGVLQRFQVALFDGNGEKIPQEPEWAESCSQIGTRSYDHFKSALLILKKPAEKCESSFLLKDAYGNRASKGRKLVLTWESFWGGDNIEIPTTVDPETGRMNHETVPARYKGKWEISVPMALNSSGEEINSPSEKKTPQKRQDRQKETAEIALPQNAAGNVSGGSAPQTPRATNPLWWLLRLFPLTLLIWLVVRLWKHPKK